MMNLYFDFDGVLSIESIQRFCQKLSMSKGVRVSCITTRNEKNADEVREICDALGMPCYILGDMIDEGILSCKADYIQMKMRFMDLMGEDSFILFDNDPNEIYQALKKGILAFLVPSYLTEGLFEGIDFDVIMR